MEKILATGILPDPVIKWGIRGLLKQRLKDETSSSPAKSREKLKQLLSDLRSGPIAHVPEKANEQHYEVPPRFFEIALGDHLKYSCCYFPTGQETLTEAEHIMLKKTVERAGIKDGDKILDLGCGWGSLSFFMAEKFPNCDITSVSNSKDQEAFISQKKDRLGIKNITYKRQDVNDLQFDDNSFDKIVSIEMFEHVRNHEKLLEKISQWLKPEGKLFIHIFVHKNLTYLFEVKDDSDFMSKYFFSGGIMPSDEYIYLNQKDMQVENHWSVSGHHYALTARKWLENTDANKEEILELFAKTYGSGEEKKWFHYWRIFFMSCEELWDYKGGNEWFVSHYLLRPRKK